MKDLTWEPNFAFSTYLNECILTDDHEIFEVLVKNGADLNRPGFVCDLTNNTKVCSNGLGAAAFINCPKILSTLLGKVPRSQLEFEANEVTVG